jgi:hypothetical protein
MNIKELFLNDGGNLSHTKLWANIACASATAVFIKIGWTGTMQADVMLTYLGSVGGYSAVLRLIAAKYTPKGDEQ